MEYITSAKNQLVKNIKKLAKKKYRDELNQYVLEGEHLVEEALKGGADFVYLLTTDEGLIAYRELIQHIDEDKIRVLASHVFEGISEIPTPQKIMAVVKKQNLNSQNQSYRKILILDNVQDPGNVGTMIRTADAAGFSHVILGLGCADIYQGKVLRAMQGSQYHIAIEEHNLLTFIPEQQTNKMKIYGTELNKDAFDYRHIEIGDSFGIILGNEGQGVSKEVLALTDANLYIPILGQAESLNVAIAAGVLMFSL